MQALTWPPHLPGMLARNRAHPASQYHRVGELCFRLNWSGSRRSVTTGQLGVRLGNTQLRALAAQPRRGAMGFLAGLRTAMHQEPIIVWSVIIGGTGGL